MTKQEWLSKCVEWKQKWPVMQDEYRANDKDGKVNLADAAEAVAKVKKGRKKKAE